MLIHAKYLTYIREELKQVSTLAKAESSQRYFPQGISCIGASALDIKLIIHNFHLTYANLSANDVLKVTEYILARAEYNEEALLAFGLINKFVKRHYTDDLLLRFEFWLEHYATNWSLVDDLCIKTIYLFFLSRPHLITHTQHWAKSEISWCRRASCVVWVKFIKRQIDKSTYYLDKALIFQHCNLLLEDNDVFVQKSVGWLLKVTSAHYENDVIAYLEDHSNKMKRITIRYAIEKMDVTTRKKLLTL